MIGTFRTRLSMLVELYGREWAFSLLPESEGGGGGGFLSRVSTRYRILPIFFPKRPIPADIQHEMHMCTQAFVFALYKLRFKSRLLTVKLTNLRTHSQRGCDFTWL